MNIYYDKIEANKLGSFTTSKKVAKHQGWLENTIDESEVEQAYNGCWYLQGYAPTKPQSEINDERKQEILLELDEIDRKSARPMRAQLANKATADDERLLIELEDKAVILRTELSSLTILSQGV